MAVLLPSDLERRAAGQRMSAAGAGAGAGGGQAPRGGAALWGGGRRVICGALLMAVGLAVGGTFLELSQLKTPVMVDDLPAR